MTGNLKNWKTLFANLKPLECVEFLLLALAVILLPHICDVTKACLYILLAISIYKGIRWHRFGNHLLEKADRWTLWSMVAFVLFYLISICYSNDYMEAISDSTGKIILAAGALVFLFSDFSFLTRKHFRWIFALYVIGLFIRFIVKTIVMFIQAIKGVPMFCWIGMNYFDTFHHSYLALHLLLAIALLAVQLKYVRGKSVIWLIVAILLMSLYLLIIGCRAGMLCFALLAPFALLLLFFQHKRYVLSLTIAAAAVLSVILSVFLMPSLYVRVTETFEQLSSQNHSDVRYFTSKAALLSFEDNIPFGVGCGDKDAALEAAYKKMNVEEDFLIELFNPHNQYLDTLMVTGILGLLSLLSMVLVPFFLAIRERNWLLLAFIFSFIVSIAFESILERNVGKVFLAMFLPFLLYYARLGKNQTADSNC